MKPLYLIPARGGSKGVPGKNIRFLGGVPLIEHTVRAALSVAGPEDVVVSTDSESIAEAARRAGARVPFIRPAELATDTAGSREVMIHAIDALNATLPEEERYDTVVLLQPTTPFRNPEDIRNALEVFKKEKPGMVAGVKPASTNPYYNAYELRDDGTLKISKGEGLYIRRQDAPKVWEIDGSLYVIDAGALRAAPSIARIERIVPVETTSPYNIDIDTEIDFITAEAIYKEICRRPHR